MSKFRMLWIDDDESKISRIQSLVKQVIKSKNYEPYIMNESNIDDDSLSKENSDLLKSIKARNYDLLLIDRALSGELLGTNIIREVRNKYKIYTDIIFYSSDTKDLLKSVVATFDESSSPKDYFDGVYVVPLVEDVFIEKFDYVVDKIIGSWYNANSIRGVVLDKTSKYEKIMNEILLSRKDEFEAEKLINILKERKKNILAATKNHYNNAIKKGDNSIEYITNNPIMFNWSTKRKVLDILDKNKLGIFSNIKKLDYIMDLRNKISHNDCKIVSGELRIMCKDDGYETLDAKTIEETRNDMILIENLLKKEIKNIEENEDNIKRPEFLPSEEPDVFKADQV